jgi:hypothetical protein
MHPVPFGFLATIFIVASSILGCSEAPAEKLTIDEVEIVKPEPDKAVKSMQLDKPSEP